MIKAGQRTGRASHLKHLSAQPHVPGSIEKEVATVEHYFPYSYAQRGLCGIQLGSCVQYHERNWLTVIASTDPRETQDSVMAEICDFLQVRRWAPERYLNFSYPGGTSRSSMPIDTETRAHLGAIYREDVERPYALLQRDLRWQL